LAEEIAPSDLLRRRFHDDPAGWEEFKTAYYAELEQPPAQSAIRELLDRLSSESVTLLFAARDETRNNAVALKEWLENRVGLSADLLHASYGGDLGRDDALVDADDAVFEGENVLGNRAGL